MRPPVTATSLRASTPFAGSITRPPRSKRSYCCAYAAVDHKPAIARPLMIRIVQHHSKINGTEAVRSNMRISRRRLMQSGGLVAAGAASFEPAAAAPTGSATPEVYTRIGVRPFINCTATLTINGGSLMLPEVIEAMEQASHFHVNLEELMQKAGDRLAELLHVEWGIVTAGTAAALTHATAGVLAGSDPEKIQRLPNLEGLKSEVIIPRESRNAYDH